MLKYLNGLYIQNYIKNIRPLTIFLSDDENGQALTANINYICDQYKAQSNAKELCICFVGGDKEQKELASCCKIVHKHKMKTAFCTELEDVSKIQKQLADELDYVKFKGRDKTLKKDYSPFGDIEDWIDM